ncbi:MAG: hypothetical protein PHP42_03530 [Bacteroidota bacterium]|nr:hypothetical protein [Bacteroidota bacterium]
MSLSKIKFLISVICLAITLSYGQGVETAGTFSRMGFGARGMGMGNAMTAVKFGELSGSYNPAITPLLKENSASVSYGFLSLDRHLNSIFYSQPIDTNAGIALGILNSGTSKIDGRDGDGFHTDNYSVSENLFSLSFAMKIRKISIGLTTKIIYNSLFTDLTSTALGLDLGIIYPLTSQITLGAVIKDFNAKYKWDTSKLYGQLGSSTIEKFPLRKILGVSYALDDGYGILSAEIESNTSPATIIRVGGEVNVVEALTLRAGLDGWETKDAHKAHPSFGLTVRTGYSDWEPALNYAYIIEPYGLFAIHVISLSVKL